VQFNNATTTPVTEGSPDPASLAFRPTTYAQATPNSNQQYWMPGSTTFKPGTTIPMTQSRLFGMVLHELLHNLGFSDTDIQLSLGGPSMVSSNTDNISVRLTADCYGEILDVLQ
jgi:hypothetical protein